MLRRRWTSAVLVIAPNEKNKKWHTSWLRMGTTSQSIKGACDIVIQYPSLISRAKNTTKQVSRDVYLTTPLTRYKHDSCKPWRYFKDAPCSLCIKLRLVTPIFGCSCRSNLIGRHPHLLSATSMQSTVYLTKTTSLTSVSLLHAHS